MAGGIVAVALVVFWISRTRRLGPEPDVASLLNQLDSSTFKVLTGAIVQGEQGMFRLDHVVVSPFGVFVIQVCREAGRIDAQIRQETWRVTGGGSKRKLYNPLWDVRKVIQKLERLVGEYPYIPLVVFTRARLTGDRDSALLDAGELIGHIRGYSTVRLTEDQQAKILGIMG